TMRLGSYACNLKKDSNAYRAYGRSKVSERHRHRYEFNNSYLSRFEASGMKATGFNPDTNLVEVIEIPEHPWYVGVQFHPEYSSTVLQPHPLFVAFIKAAIENSQKKSI
ncbi:MAG TPA: gamma-glutamyl-gamma-aminobutyrate hydrolase family protein, partial [Prolixibacteraceae bacterium]|nr:gamma-glutamyl-gamma-aminobutyrate hydrolase family protein [Prolixibacteraceae bacterium]